MTKECILLLSHLNYYICKLLENDEVFRLSYNMDLFYAKK